MPKREFIFSCQNSKEQQSWITHLQQIMTKLQSRKAKRPPSKAPPSKPTNNSKNGTSSTTTAALKTTSSSNDFGPNVSEQTLFMYLNKLEWKQLNSGDRLADLQEEFEDIADIRLLPPNTVKITVISQTWIKRHTLRSQSTLKFSTSDFKDINDSSSMDLYNDDDDNENDDLNNIFELQQSIPARHMKSVDTQHTSIQVNWSEIIDKLKHFLSAESHGDILKSSWLLKKLEWRNWKKRWCMLHFNGKLEWYENKNSDKIRGSMMLNNVLSIREISYLHFNGLLDRNIHAPDWIFEIETLERKLRFACESKYQLNDWIKKLQSVAKYQKNDAMRRRASSES